MWVPTHTSRKCRVYQHTLKAVSSKSVVRSPHHMRCGVVMKVRQAATTPAIKLVAIRMFSLGNLHAHCCPSVVSTRPTHRQFAPQGQARQMITIRRRRSCLSASTPATGNRKRVGSRRIMTTREMRRPLSPASFWMMSMVATKLNHAAKATLTHLAGSSCIYKQT